MSLLSNYFRFGDHASTDFSLYISGDKTFDSPQRDYESVEVLGRNGNLIIDRGRFKNTMVSYSVFTIGDFRRKAENVRSWLLSHKGYQKLTDTYHPDEFRNAIYSGSIDFDVSALCQAGKANLTFEAQPQRFLLSGEEYTQVNPGQTVQFENPTAFESAPFILVHGAGSGVITIGNKQITVTGNTHSHFYIDCFSQDSYAEGGINMNPHIGYLDNFPKFGTGTTGVLFSGDFDYIRIKPRWWRV